MPITWKNVSGGGGNAAAAVGLFRTANENTNNAFDKLQEVLQQQDATTMANWDQQKENNTNAALDKLRQYATPEAYAAAQAAGELNADPAYGAQVDARAVAEASDKRLGFLQDAALKSNEYANSQRDQVDSPILAKYKTEFLSLDPNSKSDNAKAVALIEQARAAGLSDIGASTLGEYFYTTGQDSEKHVADINASKASTAASQASTKLSGIRTEGAQIELDRVKLTEKINDEAGAFNTSAVATSEEQNAKIEALKEQFQGDPIGLQAAITAQGLDQNFTSTARQQRAQEIAEVDGAAAAEAFLAATKGVGSPEENLTAEQANALSKVVAAPELQLKQAEELVTAQLVANPLAAKISEFVGDSSTLFDQVKTISENAAERDDANQAVVELLEDGEDPAIISIALTQAQNTSDGTIFWDTKGGDIKAQVRAIKNNPNFKDALTTAAKLREEKEKIQKAKINLPNQQVEIRDNWLKSNGLQTDTVSRNLGKIATEAEKAREKKEKDKYYGNTGTTLYNQMRNGRPTGQPYNR